MRDLHASKTFNRGNPKRLPADQWKNEIISQESRVWAVQQVLVADYAIGAQVTIPEADQFIEPPITDAAKALCHSMRMKKSGGFA